MALGAWRLSDNLPANAGDVGDSVSIPGLGRSLGDGSDNAFQYSCLETPMDRGACWAPVHGVSKDSSKQQHNKSGTRI